MKDLRIGVIGCGMIGREHIKRLQHKIHGCRVTALCDSSLECLNKAVEAAEGKVETYKEASGLINDNNVDAILVATPGFAHSAPVLAAIEAGKPVFCEKPLATTAKACREIVKAETDSGRRLVQVGFMRRYDRGYRQIKSLLESGGFGNPLTVKCTHRAISVDDSYTTEMAVTDTAIHEIDCLRWLLNDDWDEVLCIMGRDTKYAHKELSDPQIMIMKTKKGITVVLEVFVNCKFGYDINCEVVCEDGVINLPSPAFPTVRKDCKISTDIEQNWMLRFIDSYDVELQEWVDCVKQGELLGPTAWDGYIAEATADALVAAQISGKYERVEADKMPKLYEV